LADVFPDLEYRVRYNWLNGLELDLAIPSLKVGIEYDGRIIHTNATRDNRKSELCQQNGWKLIRVREFGAVELNNTDIIYWVRADSIKDWKNAIIKILIFCQKQDVNTEDLFKKPFIYQKIFTNVQYNSLDSKYPELAKCWDPNNNGLMKPTEVPYNGHTKYFFLCETCGKSHSAAINNKVASLKRNGKCLCPTCAKRLAQKKSK
jgi:hypothetical protein